MATNFESTAPQECQRDMTQNRNWVPHHIPPKMTVSLVLKAQHRVPHARHRVLQARHRVASQSRDQ